MLTGWVFFAILDYILHNKYISGALRGSIAWGAIFITFLFHIGFVWLHKQGKYSLKSVTIERLSGWKIGLYLHFFFCVLYLSFGSRLNAFEGADSSYLLTYISTLVVQELLLLLLLAVAYAIGSLSIDRVPLPISGGMKFVFGLVVGFFVLSTVLFAVAYMKWYNSYAIGTIAVIAVALGWRYVIDFFRILFFTALPRSTMSWQGVAVVYMLPVFISLNLLAFFRPFPVGFDELLLYLNTPHQLEQSGGLVMGHNAYYWSLIMGVGYIIGGNMTLVSWLSAVPGILSVFIVYMIARRFLDISWSLVCATLFYVLPTVLWHSSCDAKVDLALTMVFLMGVLLLLVYLSPDKKTMVSYRPYILAPKFKTEALVNLSIWIGILIGWSMGIKYTAFIFIPALIGGVAYAGSGVWLFSAGIVLLVSAPLLLFNVYSFTGIAVGSGVETLIAGLLLLVVGIGLLVGSAVKARKATIGSIPYLMLIAVFGMLVFSPWVVRHYQETGKVTMSALLTGGAAMPPLVEEVKKHRQHSQIDISIRHEPAHTWYASLSTPAESATTKPSGTTGSYEEKNRYMGYEHGLARYISIFRDVCTQTNVPVLPNDAGLFIYLFLPIVFFCFYPNSLLLNVLGGLLWIGLVVESLLAAYGGSVPRGADLYTALQEHNSSVSSTGGWLYGLLLSPLSLLNPLLAGVYKLSTGGGFIAFLGFGMVLITALILLQKRAYSHATTEMKALMIILGIGTVDWWLWGSGIVWYGLPLIALMPIYIIYTMTGGIQQPTQDGYLSRLLWAGTGVVLMLMLLLRMSSYLPSYAPDAMINRSFIRYACGISDETAALTEVNPVMPKIIHELNTHADKKVLRVGTFLNYFIDRNEERVYEDNQLELFNGLFEATYDIDAINQSLKSAGVEYILFDLNTGSIDETPDKSLQQKVGRFYLYLSNNKHIEFTTTDRLVEYPGSSDIRTIKGQRTAVRYSLAGTRIIEPGTVVLIHIL